MFLFCKLPTAYVTDEFEKNNVTFNHEVNKIKFKILKL